MKKQLLLIAFIGITATALGQKVKLVDGKLPALKNETAVNIEYTYNGTGVGKFRSESDYVANRKSDLNKKEAGTGDTWAIKWEEDKTQRFAPKFEELFSKYSGLKVSKDAKYTIIFNTIFMEPGFNVGVHRKNALLNGEATIVETANRGKILAKVNITKAKGKSFFGADFDTGTRLAETYAVAGRGLAKLIKK